MECESKKNCRMEVLFLKDFDLIVIGAPTEWMTASKPMKEFLESLRKSELS
jgi:multimeric flavodoxin WrbA